MRIFAPSTTTQENEKGKDCCEGGGVKKNNNPRMVEAVEVDSFESYQPQDKTRHGYFASLSNLWHPDLGSRFFCVCGCEVVCCQDENPQSVFRALDYQSEKNNLYNRTMLQLI